jgi:hypothetical protein
VTDTHGPSQTRCQPPNRAGTLPGPAGVGRPSPTDVASDSETRGRVGLEAAPVAGKPDRGPPRPNATNWAARAGIGTLVGERGAGPAGIVVVATRWYTPGRR